LVDDVIGGFADFGLCGADRWGELDPGTQRQLLFKPVGELACRFALAVPVSDSPKPGEQLRVATSYPRALQRLIAEGVIKKAVTGPIRKGRVEGAIGIDGTNGVFDITETGASVAANGLQIIYQSERIELGGVWRNNGDTKK
jgi:ATP phosphoribosyltransferase